MDIRNLMTFIQAAELNSFTRAAEKLGYSQSTVSFQIKQLERELDSQLFERINHTIALTEDGRELLGYAHQISKLTTELKDSMQKEKNIQGHIRLAMADSLCQVLLGENFADFRKQYPGITLKVIAAGTEEMFRLLNHNEADAILTLDHHFYNTDYVIVREEKAGIHFVAGAASPLAQAGELSIQELSCHPFILTEKGMSYRRLMDERLAELSLEIKPVLEIGSADLIASLVEQGTGVSFLPDYVTESKVKAGTMVRLQIRDFEIGIWKQLLYHRDKWVSRQMDSVLDYCAVKVFNRF